MASNNALVLTSRPLVIPTHHKPVGHMFVQVPSVPFQVHVLFYSGSLTTDRVQLVSSVLPLCKYWLGSSP